MRYQKGKIVVATLAVLATSMLPVALLGSTPASAAKPTPGTATSCVMPPGRNTPPGPRAPCPVDNWLAVRRYTMSSGPDKGYIQVMINRSDITGAYQALVRFNSTTGNIATVTDTGLQLWGAGLSNPVESNGYQTHRNVNSTNTYFSTNWYNTPPYTYWHSTVKYPCMSWTNGYSDCLLTHAWWDSYTIFDGWPT